MADNAYEELMAGTFAVGFWQYWLLPLWAMFRHPFGVHEWYVQISERTETIEDDVPGKTVTVQRYLKKVGKRG